MKKNKTLTYLRYAGYVALGIIWLITAIMFVVFKFSNPELTSTQLVIEQWELLVINFVAIVGLYFWFMIYES